MVSQQLKPFEIETTSCYKIIKIVMGGDRYRGDCKYPDDFTVDLKVIGLSLKPNTC